MKQQTEGKTDHNSKKRGGGKKIKGGRGLGCGGWGLCLGPTGLEKALWGVGCGG